jgi:tetraacyldisaccharide 4'-kinase
MMTALTHFWYQTHPLRWCLYPLTLVYMAVAALRRKLLLAFFQQQTDIPVIVVGNITVGGTGKTPLVIALVQYFQARGLRVGVVTRGYGHGLKQFPHCVTVQDDAACVGDEALLIFKKTQAAVVIAPKRMQAVQYLREQALSDIIISDDGLQHYAMGRAVEIAVIDGVRGLGNQMCLPAGPLRESPRRLQHVDFVVVNTGKWPNAYAMELRPGALLSLTQGIAVLPKDLPMPVAAVAGIGHPERFFNTLNTLQVQYAVYRFPDHHPFTREDFDVPEAVVVMTEKDAVKCQQFATDSMYALSVEAVLDETFWRALINHPQLTRLNLT